MKSHAIPRYQPQRTGWALQWVKLSFFLLSCNFSTQHTTKAERHYDLLSTANGELALPRLQDLSVAAVNAFFEKNFVPAYLDGQFCNVHQF